MSASAAKSKPKSGGKKKPPRVELDVSPYDRTSSSMLALIVLLGGAVIALGVILLSRRAFEGVQPIPVTIQPVVVGEAGPGLAQDPEPMGAEDMPELERPQLLDALAAVSDAVGPAALLDDQLLEGDRQTGKGSGKGFAASEGRGGTGVEERVPRHERWEIRFAAQNLRSYARQLDHFGIELGVLDRDRIYYLSGLSQQRPNVRTDSPAEEKRLYMTWRSGALQAADRSILTKAKVPLEDNISVQFYPAEVENRLASLELQHAQGRDVNQIRKTVFGVRAVGNGYEFHVVDQKYF